MPDKNRYYTILPKNKKVEKNFDTLLSRLSSGKKRSIIRKLAENPFPALDEIPQIEKKGRFFCIDVSKGDRILYEVLAKEKYVLVHFAGNHDDYIRYLQFA